MSTPTIQHLKTLRFSGGRFEQNPGWLGFDALTELLAYKDLLIETASEEWKRRDPKIRHSSKWFKENLCLGFREIQEGSCMVNVEQVSANQLDLFGMDYGVISNQAVEIIDNTLIAARHNMRLPEDLPSKVIPLLNDWGKMLRDDECIDLSEGNKKGAIFDVNTRKKLQTFQSKPYQDLVELTGEVRATNLKKGTGGSFKILLENSEIIPGVFTHEQEATVTEALRDHRQVQLWVKGMGEFDPSGQLQHIKNIDRLEIRKPGERPVDPIGPSIWEKIARIRESIPEEAWDDVPTDLASNLDHYLYGTPKKNQE